MFRMLVEENVEVSLNFSASLRDADIVQLFFKRRFHSWRGEKKKLVSAFHYCAKKIKHLHLPEKKFRQFSFFVDIQPIWLPFVLSPYIVPDSLTSDLSGMIPHVEGGEE